MTRSSRAMVAVVVCGAVILVMVTSSAQEAATQVEGTRDAAQDKSKQALLDELDQVRPQVELLKIEQEAGKSSLKQLKEMVDLGSLYRVGDEKARSDEQERQQGGAGETSYQRYQRMQEEYLRRSKKLALLERRLADLLRQVAHLRSDESRSEVAQDRIQKVAEIAKQVQIEVAKSRGEGARNARESTKYVRVGEYVVDMDKFIYVKYTKDATSGSLAEIHLSVGEVLHLQGKDAEAFERELTRRGR
jgi:hypothetical protein